MPSFLLSLWTSPCGISLSARHTTSVDICTAHIQLFPSPVRVLHSLPHQLWLLGTEVRDHPIFPCPAECSDMLVGFPEHQAALQVGYRMPSPAELPGPQLLDALSPTPQKLGSSYRQLEKSCCKKMGFGLFALSKLNADTESSTLSLHNKESILEEAVAQAGTLVVLIRNSELRSSRL